MQGSKFPAEEFPTTEGTEVVREEGVDDARTVEGQNVVYCVTMAVTTLTPLLEPE
jgi:hypothetical protein